MTKVYCIGCGLVTPVGNAPSEVLSAVRAGKSAFRLYDGWPEPYYASLLDREGFEGPSFFDHIALQAARTAVQEAGIDASGARVGLVLSTIKGNIEKIDTDDVSLAAAAETLAQGLGVKTKPVVVSNACISGLAALLQGVRMIRSGAYDHIIVVGAEVQSRFIVTGFQSLKALSLNPCRPFDADRDGLNVGEAAAAMVLSSQPVSENSFSGRYPKNQFPEGAWEIVDGAVRNDANHISGPSRTGEGSYNALRYVLEGVSAEELAFVNVHGTATRYNDQMEAIALNRAGLQEVPVNALKGIFGHTMGAAGILESIVSMKACDAGVVLPTQGFSQMGVEPAVNVSAQERKTDKKAFVKLLSGFGGVNGALLFRKGGAR
ncbi:MAG: beta-ketoacyl synthase [Bacteroidales bacterium]|jgi:3-oxoacyl-[acyl-carrier-protein] synthase-1|nr:beta-ketoacyl synthase [Bacteroidales bacterium]